MAMDNDNDHFNQCPHSVARTGTKEQTIEFISSHPKLAYKTKCDDAGWFPLHTACSREERVSTAELSHVVEAWYNACPEALLRPSTSQNGQRGVTPFTLIMNRILKGTTMKSVPEFGLNNDNDDVDDVGSTLFFLLRMGALQLDDDGQTSLHRLTDALVFHPTSSALDVWCDGILLRTDSSSSLSFGTKFDELAMGAICSTVCYYAREQHLSALSVTDKDGYTPLMRFVDPVPSTLYDLLKGLEEEANDFNNHVSVQDESHNNLEFDYESAQRENWRRNICTRENQALQKFVTSLLFLVAPTVRQKYLKHSTAVSPLTVCSSSPSKVSSVRTTDDTNSFRRGNCLIAIDKQAEVIQSCYEGFLTAMGETSSDRDRSSNKNNAASHEIAERSTDNREMKNFLYPDATNDTCPLTPRFFAFILRLICSIIWGSFHPKDGLKLLQAARRSRGKASLATRQPQLTLITVDIDGNTPLHLFCMALLHKSNTMSFGRITADRIQATSVNDTEKNEKQSDDANNAATSVLIKQKELFHYVPVRSMEGFTYDHQEGFGNRRTKGPAAQHTRDLQITLNQSIQEILVAAGIEQLSKCNRKGENPLHIILQCSNLSYLCFLAERESSSTQQPDASESSKLDGAPSVEESNPPSAEADQLMWGLVSYMVSKNKDMSLTPLRPPSCSSEGHNYFHSLYPFMIAAVSMPTTNNNKESTSSCNKSNNLTPTTRFPSKPNYLSTTYFLLQEFVASRSLTDLFLREEE